MCLWIHKKKNLKGWQFEEINNSRVALREFQILAFFLLTTRTRARSNLKRIPAQGCIFEFQAKQTFVCNYYFYFSNKYWEPPGTEEDFVIQIRVKFKLFFRKIHWSHSLTVSFQRRNNSSQSNQSYYLSLQSRFWIYFFEAIDKVLKHHDYCSC